MIKEVKMKEAQAEIKGSSWRKEEMEDQIGNHSLIP
jgi:hypothetical protein